MGLVLTRTWNQEPPCSFPEDSLEAKRLCLPAPNFAETLADSMTLTEP